MFLSELLHWGDSDMSTRYTVFSLKKNHSIVPNLQVWDFYQGKQNEFQAAVINEPSVFKPLKVYCNVISF